MISFNASPEKLLSYIDSRNREFRYLNTIIRDKLNYLYR